MKRIGNLQLEKLTVVSFHSSILFCDLCQKKILFLHFHHSLTIQIDHHHICCSCRSIVFVEKELLKNFEFANFDENNAKLMRMRKVPTLLFAVSVFLSLQTNSADLASGQKEILAISPFSCRLITIIEIIEYEGLSFFHVDR